MYMACIYIQYTYMKLVIIILHYIIVVLYKKYIYNYSIDTYHINT